MAGEALRAMVSLTEARLRVVPTAVNRDGYDHHPGPVDNDRL